VIERNRELVIFLCLSSIMSCRDSGIAAKRRLDGYAICSSFHEGLAIVQDLKTSLYGYVDPQGEIVIRPRFIDAQPFSEGLAAAREPEVRRVGFINREGAEAIPARYQAAGFFSEGLATVLVEGKQGFIDKSGTLRIPARFDKVGPFSQGLAQYVESGLTGFVDQNGVAVIPPAYYRAGSFHNGLAWACSRTKCGYLDRQGQIRIPFTFDGAGDFSAGFAPVSIDGRWGYVDRQGKWLHEPAFALAHPFSEGFAMVGKQVSSQPDQGYGGYSGPATVYGFLDERGKFAISPNLLGSGSFSSGLAKVRIPGGGFLCSDCYSTSYLRPDGTLLSNFESGTEFREGFAIVSDQQSHFVIDASGKALVAFAEENLIEPDRDLLRFAATRYGYVGEAGEVVIPHTLLHAKPFSEGLGLVSVKDTKRYARRLFIDGRGNAQIEVPPEAGDAEPFSEGFSLLSLNTRVSGNGQPLGKSSYGYMDKTGAIRIAGEFSGAQSFSEGLAAVQSSAEPGEKKWGYLNREGKFAISPRFHAAAPFLNGIAMVTVVEPTGASKGILSGGAIDASGKIVVPAFHPETDPASNHPSPSPGARKQMSREWIPVRTKTGFAFVRRDGKAEIRNPIYLEGGTFSEGLAPVRVAGDPHTVRWGFLDTTGKLAIPAAFDHVRPFQEGLAVAQDSSGRFGYLNHKGEWAIQASFFEEANDFNGGRALVKLNGFYGYLKTNGEFAIRPQFIDAKNFSEGLAATARIVP